MKELTPELRAHIATKKITDKMTDKARSLVDTTNIMGGDSYVAASMLALLESHPQANTFCALLRDATPHILKFLSPNDGRVEATHAMLNKVNKELGDAVVPDKIAEAFAQGIVRSHSTLIQSFYRVILEIGRAKNNQAAHDKLASLNSTTDAYNKVKEETTIAFKAILDLCEQIVIPESDDYGLILDKLVSQDTYLPFI